MEVKIIQEDGTVTEIKPTAGPNKNGDLYAEEYRIPTENVTHTDIPDTKSVAGRVRHVVAPEGYELDEETAAEVATEFNKATKDL